MLVSAGKLERVARGVYSLPNQAISEYRSLAEVAIRVPRGVICLVSALRVHDIGTQAPLRSGWPYRTGCSRSGCSRPGSAGRRYA